MRLGEARLVRAQELLEVLFDQAEERGSRARRGRYTRAQISTPPHLPAGDTGANQERLPRVQRGEESATSSRRDRSGPGPRGLAGFEYPGIALVNALHLEAGIRAVEIGTVMFGTQSHIDYVAEAVIAVAATRERLRGYRITTAPKMLRHFTARFDPLGATDRAQLVAEV